MSIFVFGSNMAGRHGKGAALYAKQNHGAIYGQGEGRQGNSYGIATKDSSLRSRTLEDVEKSVLIFIMYAAFNLKENFEVTRIGCGLAGFKDKEIAPLFKNAPNNCNLPDEWKTLI